MIKVLLENKASVSLFTRPRRFGKTLNQSMIRRFFEDEITEQGDRVGNSYLFEGFYDEMKGKECLVKILQLYTVEYTVIARYRGLIKSPIIIVY